MIGAKEASTKLTGLKVIGCIQVIGVKKDIGATGTIPRSVAELHTVEGRANAVMAIGLGCMITMVNQGGVLVMDMARDVPAFMRVDACLVHQLAVET